MPSNLRRKIVGLEQLRAAAAEARAASKTVVQCHGCFDIVHPGHIRYLEFARRQGDVLIVSLAGDGPGVDSSSNLSDPDRTTPQPVIPERLRAENLAALMFVDYVYINTAPTAETVLNAVRPDLYVKGHEYEHSDDPAFLAEKAAVEANGGRILYSSGEIVFSTAELIGRMPLADAGQSHRLTLLADRHDLTARDLGHTVDRFKDLHVLVVGDIVVDRYVICDAMGVASESPMLSLTQRDERTFVGGAAIVARHLTALGARTLLLSAAGTDPASRSVADVLQRERVDAHLIESRDALVHKTRYLAEDSKLFKVDQGRVLPLDSAAERRAALLLEQQCKIADAVIFCDFGYGMITGGLLSRVLPMLRQNVKILSADVSGERGGLLSFRNVDLLCPTERELRSALNDHDSGLSAAAWDLLERTAARHLFVTLEKRGMVVFQRRSQDRTSPAWSGRLVSEPLPALGEHAVDRLGCGDAMLAAATLALAGGSSLMEAAYLGSAAAAIQISLLGNHPIPARRLRDWLAARSELARSPGRPLTASAVTR